MIHISDNFLEDKTFERLQEYCKKPFSIQKRADKEFMVLPTPKGLYGNIAINGHEIIFSFIRKAKSDFDTNHNIHADNIIEGKRVDLASVLYVNDLEGVTPNGTSFWEHEGYGHRLPENISPEKFNDLIKYHSNEMVQWNKTDHIVARPNRFLIYDAQMFHSKWPQVVKKGERIVLVSFYCKK